MKNLQPHQSHIDPGLFINKTLTIEDEDGESSTEIISTYVREVFSTAPTKDEAERYFDNTMNSHCTHSHDCCGGWYSSVRRVIKTPDPFVFLVVVRHYQNV